MKLFQTQQAVELISNGLTDVSDKDTLVTTFLPTRATSGSAGYDIRACIAEPITIYAGETVKIPTGFHLQTEDSSIVGTIYVRSSIGIKHDCVLANGTGIIDADYPEEWLVVLRNTRREDWWHKAKAILVAVKKAVLAAHSTDDFLQLANFFSKAIDQEKENKACGVTIVPGQRIAQVVFTPVVHLQELQGHSFDNKRVGGVGSTNKLQAIVETTYKEGDIECLQ